MDEGRVPALRECREVDVSDWNRKQKEELGTKPKLWLEDPATDERWLMKYVTFSRNSSGVEYRKGDDWSERIAFGIAESLGLPAAKVELAFEDVDDGERKLGTVCRSVLQEGESLINGDVLMSQLAIMVSKRRRERYTVEAIWQALEAIEPPAGADRGSTAWDVFVGYLVLDALVGNSDRHEENWSAVRPAGNHGPRRLAPTFDHASSLGFQLNDQQKEERLESRDSNFTPEGWADRAKTLFAGRPHPIEAVEQARRIGEREAVDTWISRVRQVDDLVSVIWAVPEARMSGSAKSFAERMVRRNWNRLAG